MSELVDFLLARIADDEALAENAATGWWPSYWRQKAECEAKRNLIDRSTPPHVLRTLAAVYADHPDYREEWR